MVEVGDDVKFLTFEGGGGGLTKIEQVRTRAEGDPSFGENVRFCENVITE